MKTAYVVVAAVVVAAVAAGAVVVWRRRKGAAQAELVPEAEKRASGVPAPVVIKKAVEKFFPPEGTPIFAPRAASEVLKAYEVPPVPAAPGVPAPLPLPLRLGAARVAVENAGVVAPSMPQNTGIVPASKLSRVGVGTRLSRLDE